MHDEKPGRFVDDDAVGVGWHLCLLGLVEICAPSSGLSTHASDHWPQLKPCGEKLFQPK